MVVRNSRMINSRDNSAAVIQPLWVDGIDKPTNSALLQLCSLGKVWLRVVLHWWLLEVDVHLHFSAVTVWQNQLINQVLQKAKH